MEILIVEDLDGPRSSMAKLLSQRGHRVIEAVNGIEASEQARTNYFDLIITEIILPLRNGYDFLREVAPLKPATRFMLIDRENVRGIGIPSDIETLILPGDLKSRGVKWLTSLLPD